MKQLTKWVTGGAVLVVTVALTGCSSAGSGSTFGHGATNAGVSATNIASTQNNSGFDNNAATGNVSSTESNAQASNAPTSPTSVPPVTLENIQYSHDSFLLTMTRGNMQETYSNPHFTSGTTKQFVITLRNTNPGKYRVNQVEPIKSNWAKSMLITKTGTDIVITFDLKKSFQSFQTGVAGGFEIQFSFR